jgi:LysR family hydrogen peroxide-inducible transcriptional activator
VRLTPVGQEIVDRARHVLRDVEQIRLAARRSLDPETGTLRLGLFPTLAPYLLPHVVPGIRKRFPQLKLQLAEEKTADILEMLERGSLDAGLLALPLENDQLEFEVLFDEPFVMALPESHPLAGQPRVELRDLEDAELLLLEDGHCLRDHALEVCALAGARERVDFHATSMETLRQMVAAEVGVTLMPVLAVKPPIASTGNIVLRPFAEPAPSRTIALVWRRTSPFGEMLRKLADCLRDLPAELFEAA